MGLKGIGLGMNLDDNTTTLNTGRISDISWNGRRFVCRAILLLMEGLYKKPLFCVSEVIIVK